MVNTRDKLYRKFQKVIIALAARDGGARTKETTEDALEKSGGAGRDGTVNYSLEVLPIIDAENEGPDRQIIKAYPGRWKRRLNKAVRAYEQMTVFISRVGATILELNPWREKSDIELEEEAEIKRRKKERKKFRAEVKEFTKRATRAYFRMGQYYEPPIHRKSFINGTKKVKFSHAVAEPNTIWLKINGQQLPQGVDILKLVTDEIIITNVSCSLRHHVQGMYDVEHGAWLCIERGRGVRGIPQIVTFNKMIKLMPKDSDKLTIPLGETNNSRRLFRSLSAFPHMLIGGATGQGKTSFENIIICTLITRNTPEELKIILVDLKNGVEFEKYKGVPHLWELGPDEEGSKKKIAPGGVVGRQENVIPLLKRLIKEGERRLNQLRSAKVSNIEEFNKHRRKGRMSRILVLFDEWARIALREDGKKADNLLAEIAATYRAAGFHIVVATQTPMVRVISTLIKTNFSARLAFGVPQYTSSQIILDNGKAKGLQPRGRAIFQFGIMEEEVQVPYLEPGQIKRAISAAKVTNQDPAKDEIETMDILKYSLDHLNGSLGGDKIFNHFKGKIGWNVLIDLLKSIDEMIVSIDGVEYVIVPPDGGAKPRHIKQYRGVNGSALPESIKNIGYTQ